LQASTIFVWPSSSCCQWYAKLSTFLLSNNYYISAVNHSLFLKYNNDKLTVILVYVDDLVLTGDDTKEINTITASLHHHLKIKNLGHLTYFLGLEIARNSSGIHLSQCKYTLDLLHETGMLDSTLTPPVSLPTKAPLLMLMQLPNTKDSLDV